MRRMLMMSLALAMAFVGLHSRYLRSALLVALAVLGGGIAGLAVSGVMSATGSSFPAPTPEAACGPGAWPETGITGNGSQRCVARSPKTE